MGSVLSAALPLHATAVSTRSLYLGGSQSCWSQFQNESAPCTQSEAKMERVEAASSNMNAMPGMFHAGISSKFTKRHVANFLDTTLTAASAAKQRAERKLERQADAIERQKQKIESEMKKIEEITQNLHRQQLREAKRLRSRLNYAATRVQTAYRCHLTRTRQRQHAAATQIQRVWRGVTSRRLCSKLRARRKVLLQNEMASVITHYIRVHICRKTRVRKLKRREWATVVIQSAVRTRMAKKYAQEQRRQRGEAETRHRAAIRIQCNARSFMTRLIYLDVLYLICRIQAGMRGALVRKQLRWIRAADVETITRLQAHVRGLLARREIYGLQSESSSDVEEVFTAAATARTVSEKSTAQFGGRRNVADLSQKMNKEFSDSHRLVAAHTPLERAGSLASTFGVRTRKSLLERPLDRASTGLGWELSVEPVIKRSYWLPAGVSLDRRLPVLPVAKRGVLSDLDSRSPDDGDDSRPMFPGRTPKKRPHQKPGLVRLSPVVIPSMRNGPTESDTEEDNMHMTLETEERARREEELKLKLLSRRTQEKRRQEHELRLQREAENEANERKLMEREEKSMRLQFKISRRRSKEGRIRKLSADQRREERERLAMVREERHMRLHLKIRARQRSRKRLQLGVSASATASPSPTLSTITSESMFEATATSVTPLQEPKPRRRSTTERIHIKKATKSDKNSKCVMSNDDEELSFLNIDFAIPTSMKLRQQTYQDHPYASSQHRKPHKKQTLPPTQHPLSKPSKQSSDGKSNQRGERMHGRTLKPDKTSLVPFAQIVNEEEEVSDGDGAFDYGNDFDEIIDEAALAQLMC